MPPSGEGRAGDDPVDDLTGLELRRRRGSCLVEAIVRVVRSSVVRTRDHTWRRLARSVPTGALMLAASVVPLAGAAGLVNYKQLRVLATTRFVTSALQPVTSLGTPPMGFATADGIVYVLDARSAPSSTGALVRIESRTGRVTATTALPGTEIGTPLIVGPTVWVEVADGSRWTVLALNATSLRIVHRLLLPTSGTMDNTSWPSLAAAGGDIWAAGGPILFRIGSDDTVTKQIRLQQSGRSSVGANAAGTALAVSLADTSIERLEPRTGAMIHHFANESDNFTEIAAIVGHTIWVAQDQANSNGFAGVNLTTGTVTQLPGGGNQAKLIPAGDDLLAVTPIVASSLCIDGLNGKVVAQLPAKVNKIGPLVGLADGWLYVSAQRGDRFELERAAYRGC